ncbi:MAG: hypothetical protein EZS28_020962 [Streblomastix strix]|uniref:Uncharacterized protein n=1 Tax=Streblomastix strix TaxID=222440 RepID=A0A5J4VMK7_9EUKA|nr:MAG: hypothetical protein EZS28_020962 [Streblomastix strix]
MTTEVTAHIMVQTSSAVVIPDSIAYKDAICESITSMFYFVCSIAVFNNFSKLVISNKSECLSHRSAIFLADYIIYYSSISITLAIRREGTSPSS